MTEAARVEMSGITKRYGLAYALHDVTFRASPGEIHALMGENGAGKSTLVRVLSGAIQAEAGEMRIDGKAYVPRKPHDAREQGIRAVYQDFSLVPQLSVAENLLLGEMPTRGPGIVELGRRPPHGRRQPGSPGLRGHRHAPTGAPAGRLAATDGGDRQGHAGRAACRHPRRALGRPLKP